MIEKLERDGKVAIIYSDGYGAGWTTWNGTKNIEAMVFDKELAEKIETSGEDYKSVLEFVKKKYPDTYNGGADTLTIEWVPKGTEFIIHEYDGLESVWTKENMHWFKA